MEASGQLKPDGQVSCGRWVAKLHGWVCKEFLLGVLDDAVVTLNAAELLDVFHPKAAVVNLGCGLDTTFNQTDNGLAAGYNLDLPDVIGVRNELLGHIEREHNIPCDLNDLSWMDAIHFSPENGVVFFASGLLYYFKTEEVQRLLCEMAKRFPGGKIVFDATNAKGLKNMLKTWLKPAQMQNVGLYFSVNDEREMLAWSGDFASVVRKGYMTGYRPLDRRYGLIANAVFRFGDQSRMCQIIEIEFKSEQK